MIATWLGDAAADAICVLDPAAVAQARERTREVGRSIDMPVERLERMVTAVSELANNQLAHARGGMIAVRAVVRGVVPALEVVAADRGDGLRDPRAAFRGTGQLTGSLGVGVAAIRRLTDELDVDIRVGAGTCLWARKYVEPARREREVGIWSQPREGERITGDGATFKRTGPRLLFVAVVDGVGHGDQARAAADRVLDTLCAHDDMELDAIMILADSAARDTRGAAATAMRVDDSLGQLAATSVGNVSALLRRRDGSQWHLGGLSATVGSKQRELRKVRVERVAADLTTTVVMFSDGVSSRATLDPALMAEHPVVIAHAIATAHGRASDDVTVLVAK